MLSCPEIQIADSALRTHGTPNAISRKTKTTLRPKSFQKIETGITAKLKADLYTLNRMQINNRRHISYTRDDRTLGICMGVWISMYTHRLYSSGKQTLIKKKMEL